MARKPHKAVASARSSEEFREKMGSDIGIPITVVSDDEAETCEAVICIPKWMPSQFADNLVDRCCVCAAEVWIRPWAPKRPPRLCLPCYLDDKEPPRPS